MKNTDDDLTPVTTRGGDDGRSGLIDGSRRFKDDLIFDALGYIDEAQVSIGCARAAVRWYGQHIETVKFSDRLAEELETVQYLMLTAGGVMACPLNHPPVSGQPVITEADISRIDQQVTLWKTRVELEPRFFVAGDTRYGAEFDRARTVIRRAERAVVAVVRRHGMDEQKQVSRFLNRLSDWMFILARWADQELTGG